MQSHSCACYRYVGRTWLQVSIHICAGADAYAHALELQCGSVFPQPRRRQLHADATPHTFTEVSVA